MFLYYVGNEMYGDQLFHHGIKGQKWGVRRYQNTDGSLTAAGKQRYQISSEGLNAINRVRNAYAKNEIAGRGHAKINEFDTRRSLSSLQEDSRGNRIRLSNPDDYKFFEQTEKSAADKVGLDQKRKAYVQSAKAYQKAFFGKGKARENMKKALADYQDAGKEYTDRYLTESVKYIDKLPKKERELYLDYLYQRLGWDW